MASVDEEESQWRKDQSRKSGLQRASLAVGGHVDQGFSGDKNVTPTLSINAIPKFCTGERRSKRGGTEFFTCIHLHVVSGLFFLQKFWSGSGAASRPSSAADDSHMHVHAYDYHLQAAALHLVGVVS